MSPPQEMFDEISSDAESPQSGSYNGNDSALHKYPPTPLWVDRFFDTSNEEYGEKLNIPEWEEKEGEDKEAYRTFNGWMGKDFMHSLDSPVRILGYRTKFVDGGVGTTLSGVVHFTPKSESHKGYCHGGSMCSLMDDVIGWCGFLVSGKCLPWSGFTAQVNTSLRRPVPVNAFLFIKATITRKEGRKVYVTAHLIDPCGEHKNKSTLQTGKETIPTSCIHASCEGLFIIKRE